MHACRDSRVLVEVVTVEDVAVVEAVLEAVDEIGLL